MPFYFLVFPSVSLAAHADQIIIGFIHDPYHATAVGVSYAIILVTCIALLRFIAHLIHAKVTKKGGNGYKQEYESCSYRHECLCILFAFFLALFLVLGSFAFFIALYYLLPISSAPDDAPNRILTIYQSIVVIFAAYLTYWVVVKTQNSPLNFLIQAKDKLVDKDADWNEYSYENKEVRIAGDLLEALRKAAQQKEENNRQAEYQPPNNQPT